MHGREFECEVQVRAHGGVVPATARLVDDPEGTTPAGRVKKEGESPWRLELDLHEPLQGVARGQAAVVYQPDAEGDILLGSGTIRATAPWSDAEAAGSADECATPAEA